MKWLFRILFCIPLAKHLRKNMPIRCKANEERRNALWAAIKALEGKK